MTAGEVMQQIKQLPETEAARLFDWLFSADEDLDRLFAAFDRFPRQTNLTEEEVLNLSRARSARQ